MVSQHTALTVDERCLGRIARLPAEGLIPKITGGDQCHFYEDSESSAGKGGQVRMLWHPGNKVGSRSGRHRARSSPLCCPEQKTSGKLAVHGPLRGVANEEWGHRAVK